nr:MAG: hypothetical protein DIU70_03535 [Bacillota bacterium]
MKMKRVSHLLTLVLLAGLTGCTAAGGAASGPGASGPAASQAAASGPAAQPATCTTPDGIAVRVTDLRPTGIDIELLFPEGYDATRAGVTVAATHWQFAALQPRSAAEDSGAAGSTAPPDTAAVTVERIRTASGAEAAVHFTLQVGEQEAAIADCR